jgi:hypothetical protein
VIQLYLDDLRGMMDEFIDPNCPDCHQKLHKLIGDIQKPTYPPLRRFECECGFEGWVMMEVSADFKADPDQSRIIIVNQQWIENLKNLIGE